jgi:hypothetical protein
MPTSPAGAPSPGARRAEGVRSAGPFADVRAALVLVAGYAVLTAVWIARGATLPGGRWFAVHLFTLGVLSNAILALSEHFARTLTRTPGVRSRAWMLVANIGIIVLLASIPIASTPGIAVGATTLVAVVSAGWWHLRSMRRHAVGARFGWVVRLYERAHGAFLHGAAIGLALGLGLVSGPWYLGARLAHLHANVLGWGGLTLMATLVFFGPTMLRTRIEDGADERAAGHLRHGASGLSVAVVALLGIGLPGAAGTSARMVAAVGLAILATAVTRTVLPVARVASHARRSAARPLVQGVCAWAAVALWADVAIVLTGTWRLLDALGVALLAGVLAPSVLATVIHLLPVLRRGTTAARDRVRDRLEVGGRARAAVLQVGVLTAATGAALRPDDLPVIGVGWALVIAVVAATLVAGLWPVTERPSPRRDDLGPSPRPAAGQG